MCHRTDRCGFQSLCGRSITVPQEVILFAIVEAMFCNVYISFPDAQDASLIPRAPFMTGRLIRRDGALSESFEVSFFCRGIDFTLTCRLQLRGKSISDTFSLSCNALGNNWRSAFLVTHRGNSCHTMSPTKPSSIDCRITVIASC